METNKNQNPEKPDEKSEAVNKIMQDLLQRSKNNPPKPADPESPKTGDLKGMESPKTYTSGELWTYGGIGSLIAGIIGYFIGQSQGKKKAEAECERLMQEYREKMEARLKERQLSGRKEKKEKPKQVFRLE